MISLVERGHVEAVSIRTLRAILRALDALVIVEVRWRGGQVDRLIDEDHAALVGLVAGALGGLGWEVRTEVTYSRYGERGSFDLLAWHAATSTLLVVEVKTQVASAEETLRKLDEKARLAPVVARERFGWSAAQASRLLVLPDVSTARRRVGRHAAIFDLALPARTVVVRRWLAQPTGALAGVWFRSASNGSSHKARHGGRDRVRCDLGLPSSNPIDAGRNATLISVTNRRDR